MASVLQTSEITDMAAWLRGRARIESEVCGDSRPNSFDEAADTLEAWAATISQCRAAGFLDENGAVRKVLGTLPVTADGCIVVWGAVIYCPHGGKITVHGGNGYCTCSSCWSDGCQGDSGDGTHHKFEKCYSTREAATAASSARKDP